MRKLQQLTQVAESDHAQGLGTDSRQHPEQDSTAADARDVAALRREMERRALPAGPPPAFQLNLLEAEGGIDQALARIEAARAQERDAPALRLADPVAAQPVPTDAPSAPGATALSDDSPTPPAPGATPPDPAEN